MEKLKTELEELIDKYSILKNNEIRTILINTLEKYNNNLDEYVLIDNPTKTTETSTNTYTLTTEMEKLLDDTLDEIENEDASTQTACFKTNRIDQCKCENCKHNTFTNIMDDIDRTFHDISYGIDEIGSFIGNWIEDTFISEED